MSIGKRIKMLRRSLDLSVDDVAEKLGKNRATIYRYESDEIENLPITVIEPLAAILNTTPSYLMGWDNIDRYGEIFDARVFFRGAMQDLIKYFGFEVVDNYAKDEEGNTTVLIEGDKDTFEIKESDYNSFFNSCFSFIDFEFNKMIKEENRIKRSFSIEDYRDKDGKIKKYKYDVLLVNAAHEIEGASDEDKAHDDALMNDDNF